MEQTIKITWEGQPAELVVGEISWGDKTNCIKKSIKEVFRGRQLKKEVDTILQKELMMLASIKKAPFEMNLDNLKKLSSKDGERLYKVYSDLNELEEDSEGEESSGSGSGPDDSQL